MKPNGVRLRNPPELREVGYQDPWTICDVLVLVLLFAGTAPG